MSLIPLAPFLLRSWDPQSDTFGYTDSLRLPPAEQLTFVKDLPTIAVFVDSD
jgi:hypothetical protein